MVKFSSSEKLGLIESFDLDPFVTCIGMPCLGDGCYACKGRNCFKQKKELCKNNLMEWVTNPEGVKQEILEHIENDNFLVKNFRWFQTGDIPSTSFFEMIVEIAQKRQNTNFVLYTKQFDKVNRAMAKGIEIPKNLHVYFSAWDKQFKVNNPYNFPIVYVLFKDKNKRPNEAKDIAFTCSCEKTCSECKACYNGLKTNFAFDEH